MKICSEEIGDQGDLVDAKSKHLCVKSLNSYFLPNSSRILKEAANMCWVATMTRSKEGLWWEQNPAVKEEVEEKKILLVLSWVLLSIALIGTTQCGPRKQPSCFIYNSTIPMIFARVLDFPFFVKKIRVTCVSLSGESAVELPTLGIYGFHENLPTALSRRCHSFIANIEINN